MEYLICWVRHSLKKFKSTFSKLFSILILGNQKRLLIYVIILSILVSFIEIISVSLFGSFILSIQSTHQTGGNMKIIGEVFNAIGLAPTLKNLGVITGFFLIFTGGMQLLVSFYSAKVDAFIGVGIANNLFKRCMEMKYIKYSHNLSRNTSFVLFSETQRLTQLVILPIVIMLTKIVFSVTALSFLFYLNINVALISFTICSLMYVLLYKIIRPHLILNGSIVSDSYDERYGIAEDALQGRYDAIQFKATNIFDLWFKKSGVTLANAQGKAVAFSLMPRHLVETMVFISIIIFFITIFSNNYTSSNLPEMAMIILLGLKILPSLQSIFISLTQINANWASVNSIYNLNNQTLKTRNNKDVSSLTKGINSIRSLLLAEIKIELKDEKQWLLDGKCEFTSGNFYYLSGKSGVGKSTLLDIIAGRRHIDSGKFLINGNKVYDNIFDDLIYIQQKPHLFKNTICFNITFQDSCSIDKKYFKHVLKVTGLDKDFSSDSELFNKIIGVDTNVSGGQAQRISIARALYKKCQWLIMDEATNALDKDAEKVLMELIFCNNYFESIIFTNHNKNFKNFADTEVKLVDNGKSINLQILKNKKDTSD